MENRDRLVTVLGGHTGGQCYENRVTALYALCSKPRIFRPVSDADWYAHRCCLLVQAPQIVKRLQIPTSTVDCGKNSALLYQIRLENGYVPL